MIEQAYLAMHHFICIGDAARACECAVMLAHCYFVICPDLREERAA